MTTVTTGTRDPAQTPFASDSMFNLPLGTGAQWTPNAQLSNSVVFINTVGNYNENIYASAATDPLVTVTDSGATDGIPATYTFNIPANAVPSGGTDGVMAVDDTATHTWYSLGGFQWTGANTAVANGGSAEPDFGSGIADNHGNDDEGVGTLRQSDLQAGTIDHMLRMELPTDMLKSYSSFSDQLAPNAWPRTTEDYNGPWAYTGTVDFGVTIGIPIYVAEPAAIAANAGANMLWLGLQHHGAQVRDSGGGGNTVIFQADQQVNPDDPLIASMQQFGSQIMSYAQILANQGPTSVNGGGAPVVPLDLPLSDAPGGSAGATASPSDTVVTANANASITDAAGHVWTITSAAQVAFDGAAISGTAGVVELAYVNGVVWQQNAASNWYSIVATNGTFATGSGPTTTSPVPAAPPTASPNDTTVLAGSNAAITDATGAAWTIAPSAQVAYNGTAIDGTASVVELAYVNGVVWQQNAAKDWYSIVANGGTFSAGAGPVTTSPLPVPPPTVSPNDTAVLAGSMATITDASGNAWTIAPGAQVAYNGVAISGTASVTELAYANGVVWQENASGNWYSIIANSGTFATGVGPTTTSPLPPAAAQSSISVTASGTTTLFNGAKLSTTQAGGDTFVLTAAGVVKATLGATSSTIAFVGMSNIALTAGTAQATVTADKGANTFTTGKGALEVAGGAGADAYICHVGNGLLKIDDFSIAKGDSLTIDKGLRASMKEVSDSHGGTLLTFNGGSGIDLKNVASFPAADVHWK